MTIVPKLLLVKRSAEALPTIPGVAIRGRDTGTTEHGWPLRGFLGNSISRIPTQQLFITKIEFGAANETITTAVFNIESFAGLSESDFNTAAQSTITTSGNLDNASFDTLSFHGSRTNYDEIRLATTFDAAVGLGAVIPEPTSVFLSFIGLGFLVIRRRK